MSAPKENAARASGAESAVHGKESASPILPTAQNLSKLFFTLQARLALKGYEVTSGRCGDFVVTRNGLSRYIQDLDELQRFCLQAGA